MENAAHAVRFCRRDYDQRVLWWELHFMHTYTESVAGNADINHCGGKCVCVGGRGKDDLCCKT